MPELQPVYDKHGRQIYPGDLIKSFHFQGRRWRKKYYLYHTAVEEKGRLWLVPTAHLEPTKVSGGGKCQLCQEIIDANDGEIILGYGPGDILDYKDRPRVKREKPAGVEG